MIARLDTNHAWSQAGQLIRYRGRHNAIAIDGEFLIVGGYDWKETERCRLNEEMEMTCTTQQPVLYDFSWWPALFEVEPDYCARF